MKKMELAQKMRDVHAELQQLDAVSSLSLLSKRLSDETDPLYAFELKITKAKLLSSLGRSREAVDILNECSSSMVADESAAYFAAEILVEGGHLAEATDFLERAELQIKEPRSAYYSDCIFLLHAFCEASHGNAERASELLARVSDRDEALNWLKTETVISFDAVKKLIAS